MCGRFVSATPLADVAAFFKATPETVEHTPDFNVTPRRMIYAVREIAGDGEARRVLSGLRWGLIPSWAKDAGIGDRLINARSETVREKPAYRAAFAKRRCIIPADGFYEWQVRPEGKQPMYIHRRDGRQLAFAGLWEHWTDPSDGTVVETCAVLTTNANATMAPIHERMPVILERDACDVWCDPASNNDVVMLESLLRPADDAVLATYAVGRAVNSPRNNGSSLLEPAVPETLF
ncbi:MAG: SOS response-associated peptidase [Acidimicrobiia bacterium]